MGQIICSEIVAAEVEVLAAQSRRVARLLEHVELMGDRLTYVAALRDQLDAMAAELESDSLFLSGGPR